MVLLPMPDQQPAPTSRRSPTSLRLPKHASRSFWVTMIIVVGFGWAVGVDTGGGVVLDGDGAAGELDDGRWVAVGPGEDGDSHADLGFDVGASGHDVVDS